MPKAVFVDRPVQVKAAVLTFASRVFGLERLIHIVGNRLSAGAQVQAREVMPDACTAGVPGVPGGLL